MSNWRDPDVTGAVHAILERLEPRDQLRVIDDVRAEIRKSLGLEAPPGEAWVVVLMGSRNPYDGEGGLRIVHATGPEEAVHLAHDKPPSTTQVKFAWTAELASKPFLIPADVPSPEWGQLKKGRQ